MTARVLDGNTIAASVRERVAAAVSKGVPAGRRRPGLAVVLVGESPASRIYVRKKRQDCEQVGFISRAHDLPATTGQEDLLALVDRLNADAEIDGILVQLPLPEHIDSHAVIERIDPGKDVDGFHPVNIGRLALGLPGLRPCTPAGIMTLLAATGEDLTGRDAVVIGRSSIVGRPMALELINARCTVTVCHSRTRDLPARVRAADIVVAAVGRERFVAGEWVRPGAIVIDVGINRNAEGRLVGDVDYVPAAERAGWTTPVPGGVGPMTRATLLENTVSAAEARGHAGAGAPTIPAERRHFSRIAMDRPARLNWNGCGMDVHVEDLSLRGALLRLPADALPYLDRDADYRFALMLGESERIEMALEQMHEENDLVGFRCRSIDLESISELRRLVELNLGDPDLLQRELAELAPGG